MSESVAPPGIRYLCHACGNRLEYRDYGKWYWCPKCLALRRKPKHPALIMNPPV